MPETTLDLNYHILCYWGKLHPHRFTMKENQETHSFYFAVSNALPQVFGADWPSNGTDYSVYKEWQTDDRQLLEMISYKGIKGLRKCSAFP